MKDDIKTHCYSGKCDIVITGFNSNWYICRECDSEVTEKLAKQIEEYKKKEKEAKSDEDMDLFGLGGYIPNGNDDGFY